MSRVYTMAAKVARVQAMLQNRIVFREFSPFIPNHGDLNPWGYLRPHNRIVRAVRVRGIRVGGWIVVPDAGIRAVAELIFAARFQLQRQHPGAVLLALHRVCGLVPDIEIAHQVQALTALYSRHGESHSDLAVGRLFCDHRPLLQFEKRRPNLPSTSTWP